MKALILLIVFLTTACAMTYTLKPTVATNPKSYLRDFPIGEMTEDNLVDKLGVPDDVMIQDDGNRLLTYRLGSGWGKRQYVYVVSNGIIYDVKYFDQGPYSGITARKEQNLQ